jgi:hypothetical protein
MTADFKSLSKQFPGFEIFNLTTKTTYPLLFAFGCLLVSCANPIPPEGGPRDQTPPKLDTLASTRNFQTRFQKQTIVLAFNEWVELRDAFSQVVISPPLEHRPEIVRKKKTIQVKFDEREVLRDSATYVINFGEAIRDLTEGNVAPIVFVFSTGDYIDSLTVEGKIVDAYTAKPVENVLFMLYENLADSVVRKDRPFYFAKTDKEGTFKVSNVKSGKFKAFALLDQNLNYRFDSDAEKIAFLDSALTVSGETPEIPDSLAFDSLAVDSMLQDSTVADTSAVTASDSVVLQKTPSPKGLVMRLFEEQKALFLRSKDVNTYGLVKLTFSRQPYDAQVTFDSVGQTVFLETEKDTIRLWYDVETDEPWNVYVQRDTVIDTVAVKTGLKENFLSTASLSAAPKTGGPPVKQPPGTPFAITFNHPLAAFDPANIKLLEDSTGTEVKPNLQIDSVEKRTLLVGFPWKDGKAYEVRLLQGAVTDLFGLTNADSISRNFVAGAAKDFGTLTLKVINLDPEMAYVIRLLDKSDAPLRTYPVSGTDSFQTTLNFFPPGTYTLELIEDLDRNGRWTTGNYDLHRQPEPVQRKTLEELRANWELESEIDAGF